MIDSVLPPTPASASANTSANALANTSRDSRSNKSDVTFAQVLAKSSAPAEANGPAAEPKPAPDSKDAKAGKTEDYSDGHATPAAIDLTALMPFIAQLPKSADDATTPRAESPDLTPGLPGIAALPTTPATAAAQLAEALPPVALTSADLAANQAGKNAKTTSADAGAFAIAAAGDTDKDSDGKGERSALPAGDIALGATRDHHANPSTSQSTIADSATLAISNAADDSRRHADPASASINAATNDGLAAAAAFNAAQAPGSGNGGAISHAGTLLLATHVDAPSWSKDFGQHVIRLATEGQPTAEIHLNPPELGPIRVSIDMKGSEATVQFAAAHAETRGALEHALPMLREMFAANDIALAASSVSSQAFSQNPSHPQGQPFASNQPGRSLGLRAADDEAITDTLLRPIADRSRVDLFA